VLTKILSASHFGLETVPVEVEVNVSKKGFPGFSIIGLPGKSVDEARERVKTALVNSGVDFPNAKIVVNLAPADLPKEGSSYDLPIAIGILRSIGALEVPVERSFFYGELSLDGSLRHTKGVLLLGLYAKQKGIKNLFVPKESASEACVVGDVRVYPVENLTALIEHLRGVEKMKPLKFVKKGLEGGLRRAEFDFSEIMGQNQAKRALEVAAAGGHNIHLRRAAFTLNLVSPEYLS
jgi:magnesium chelatase family protein